MNCFSQYKIFITAIIISYLTQPVFLPRAERNKKEHNEWLLRIARFLEGLHPQKPVIFTGVENDPNAVYYQTNREILEEWIRKSTPDLHQSETWYSDIEFKFCGMEPWVSIPAMQLSCNIKLVREKKFEGNLVYICYNKNIKEWYVFEVNDDLLKAIHEVRWISAKEKSRWYPDTYRKILGVTPTEFPPSTKEGPVMIHIYF